MIYLLKAGRPNIAMRLAQHLGLIDFEELLRQADAIIEPLAVKAPCAIRQPRRARKSTGSS